MSIEHLRSNITAILCFPVDTTTQYKYTSSYSGRDAWPRCPYHARTYASTLAHNCLPIWHEDRNYWSAVAIWKCLPSDCCYWTSPVDNTSLLCVGYFCSPLKWKLRVRAYSGIYLRMRYRRCGLGSVRKHCSHWNWTECSF